MNTSAMDVPTRRTPLLSNQVFGMTVFVITEVMFFTALLSAYLVIRAGNEGFTVPANIKLPVTTTAFNTFVLLLSGGLLIWAGRVFSKNAHDARVRSLWLKSILEGFFFVGFQGFEWIQLISYGLTLKSSIFGACFYLLIGMHGLHALIGVLAMAYFYATGKDRFSLESFKAMQIFWLFIVAVWPILYFLVYFE